MTDTTDDSRVETAGPRTRAELYGELSRAYAAAGDVRDAVLAAWAADIEVLHTLLWENGLGAAPDPGAQLDAVAQAVDASLREYAAAATASDLTPRAVLAGARSAMLAAFDSSVHDVVTRRFLALDHLDALPMPGARPEAERYADRATAELTGALLAAAVDCAAVATALHAAGHVEDARHHAGQSDLAVFEGHLLRAADAAGDEDRVTVGLRWDLAALQAADGAGDGLASAERRELLAGCLAEGEQDALRADFRPVAGGTAR